MYAVGVWSVGLTDRKMAEGGQGRKSVQGMWKWTG